MLNYFQASIVLLSIWYVVYVVLKKKLIISRIYFVLLLLMGSAGIVLPLNHLLDLGTKPSFEFIYILLFALLMISAIYPCLTFDKWFSKVERIEWNPRYIRTFKLVSIVLILLSIYAVAYTLPYAIMGYLMGAADVRAYILDDSLLPVSPLTTIAVGVGFLAPIYIVFFFLALSCNKLRRYAPFIFLSSLTYLVTSASAQARDGFIMIPLTYLFMYLVFRRSLDDRAKNYIKRTLQIAMPIVLVFFMVITISRFYNNNGHLNPIESMIDGTWGYFYQQPYVFDQTLQHQDEFHGIAYRFPFVAHILGLPQHTTGAILNHQFEWMFGSMYATFYSATGWGSLIIATLFYMFSWTVVLRLLINRRNYFGVLAVLSLYLYFLISGMFYFRLSAESITITYLVLIVMSFYLRGYVLIKFK